MIIGDNLRVYLGDGDLVQGVYNCAQFFWHNLTGAAFKISTICDTSLASLRACSTNPVTSAMFEARR